MANLLHRIRENNRWGQILYHQNKSFTYRNVNSMIPKEIHKEIIIPEK